MSGNAPVEIKRSAHKLSGFYILTFCSRGVR